MITKSEKANETIKQHVTSFKNSEEKLEGFSTLIDQNIIYSKTDRQGIIIEVSDCFCQISGYSEDELIGKPHNILRHTDMPKSLFKDMWETIKSGKQWNGEIKNMKKDGGFYWVNTHLTPICDESENIIGYASIRQDITDKIALVELNKNLEVLVDKKALELMDLNTKYIETAKLAQFGEMIEDITHQWRQPLSVISAIAMKVKVNEQLNNMESFDLLGAMDAISEQTEYMSNVIMTFKQFLNTKHSSAYTELQQRLDEIFIICMHTLKDNRIRLIKDFEEEPIVMSLPKGYLAQVIINIINNARDVIVDNAVNDPWVKVSLRKKDNNAIITIEDNGGGIPKDIIDKIFDSHFTTKANDNGTGIGLHMSQRIIIESFDGKLSARNTDNGAEFNIEILIKDNETLKTMNDTLSQ